MESEGEKKNPVTIQDEEKKELRRSMQRAVAELERNSKENYAHLLHCWQNLCIWLPTIALVVLL